MKPKKLSQINTGDVAKVHYMGFEIDENMGMPYTTKNQEYWTENKQSMGIEISVWPTIVNLHFKMLIHEMAKKCGSAGVSALTQTRSTHQEPANLQQNSGRSHWSWGFDGWMFDMETSPPIGTFADVNWGISQGKSEKQSTS